MILKPLTLHRRKGLTMIELLGVISLIAVLVVLMFPAWKSVVAKANQAKCVSNLRQIGIASASYSADNDGEWTPVKNSPGAQFPTDYMIPYLGRLPGTKEADFLRSPLICPSGRTDDPDGAYSFKGVYAVSDGKNFGRDSSTGRYGMSYVQNIYASRNSDSRGVPTRAATKKASEMMLYMEMHGHWLASVGRLNDPEHAERIKKRHNGYVNIGYVDGSVRSVLYDDIPTTISPMNEFWHGRTTN